MSKIETGGPAFPIFPETGGGHAAAFAGMTLRDYFAAKAMVSLISEWGRVMHSIDGRSYSGLHIIGNEGGTPSSIADESYAMADAMLEARK